MIEDDRFAGRQGRLVFAYLVAEEGRPVPRDELAEVLWGESPPATWDKALSVVASKVRAVLADGGAGVLTSAFGCYRLELPPGSWVDVIAAADAVLAAEAALAAGDHAKAQDEAGAANALLGEPFLPGEEGEWVERKRRELDELRTRALDVLADAHLHSGAAHEAVKWAKQTVSLEPFRETGYRRLMEAHAAAGDRAEALRVYERCRRLLAEELGAYPSPETESVYRGLLEPAPRSAPAELPDVSKHEPKPTSSRRHFAFVAVAVAAAAAVVAGVLATRGGQTHAAVAPNSIVALDPSGAVGATVAVGARPTALTAAAGSLWVANFDDQSVTRVDLSSQRAVRTIPVGGAPTSVAATRSGVWVTDGAGHVATIDPTYDRVSSRRSFGPQPFFPSTVRPTLAAFGSIWLADPDGYVSRIDPDSARTTGTVDVGNGPSAIAAGAGAIWVANSTDGTVTRIDPATLLAATIPVGHGPAAVAVNPAGAWIANAGDDTVVRVDTETNAVAGTTPVGDGPSALISTPRALWVANARDGTVMRLDPRSGRVEKTIRVGGTPEAFASAAGRVWLAVAPAPPQPVASGGVAHLTLHEDVPSYDPAVSVTPQLLYPLCANLVTYPDKPAPEGSHIVPEVAEAIPAPTHAGTTYTFLIRPGFRFSPPSNQPVTAMTFKSTIERVLNPRMKSDWAPALSDVAGIAARGSTLTIRLTKPDGSFIANLAGGAACAVPQGTPAEPINGIPSAGPYYIASYAPRQQLILKRNPNYHGDRPHHLDEIVVTIGIDPARALEEIEANKADYAIDGLPRDAGPSLESRYGPGSNAAKRGHQQYFINIANAARYLVMNASRPLFAHLRLRRAVNYAIDRRALVAQGRRYAENNPFNAGEPTADYLPPAMAGAKDFHLYPLNGPDLERAKQLAGDTHATAIMYTPNVAPWVQEAEIVRRDLKPLGIDVEVKQMPLGDFFTRTGRRGEPFDLAVGGFWFASTDPSNVLGPADPSLFGGTFRPTGNSNFSYFTDPAFARKVEAAGELSGPRRYRTYNRLALDLERDYAPAAAFATDASRDFFSARMGCEVYQPVYGIDLAALCLRKTS